MALACVGNERALQPCLDAVRKQGVMARTGLMADKDSVDFFQLTLKDAEIGGSWCDSTRSGPRMIKLIASGAIPALRAVRKRISLDEALLDPAGGSSRS